MVEKSEVKACEESNDKIIFRFISFFILFLVLSNCATVTVNDAFIRIIDKKISDIYAKYGVYVYYVYDKDSFFPESWLDAPISGQGAQIDFEEVNRVLPLVETFLGKYDLKLIRKNLQSIYLLKRMSFYGEQYGGTSSYDSIYIVSSGSAGNYTTSFLFDSMVHEFAGLLYNYYADQFPEDEWLAANPEDFEYSGTGVEMLGRTDLFDRTEELLTDGFLQVYSRSSLENDFSIYSEWYFNRRDELIGLTKKYPVVRLKYELVEDFYEIYLPAELSPDDKIKTFFVF